MLASAGAIILEKATTTIARDQKLKPAGILALRSIDLDRSTLPEVQSVVAMLNELKKEAPATPSFRFGFSSFGSPFNFVSNQFSSFTNTFSGVFGNVFNSDPFGIGQNLVFTNGPPPPPAPPPPPPSTTTPPPIAQTQCQLIANVNRFRTPDGRCNNPVQSELGSAGTPFSRELGLTSHYEDGNWHKARA